MGTASTLGALVDMPFIYSIAAWILEKLIGSWWKPKQPKTVAQLQAEYEAKPKPTADDIIAGL
jgi:hypothetical protein